MPSGLQESEKLARPMFTPSTKAEQGQHDENIHPDTCSSLALFKITMTSKEADWGGESDEN